MEVRTLQELQFLLLFPFSLSPFSSLYVHEVYSKSLEICANFSLKLKLFQLARTYICINSCCPRRICVYSSLCIDFVCNRAVPKIHFGCLGQIKGKAKICFTFTFTYIFLHFKCIHSDVSSRRI